MLVDGEQKFPVNSILFRNGFGFQKGNELDILNYELILTTEKYWNLFNVKSRSFPYCLLTFRIFKPTKNN